MARLPFDLAAARVAANRPYRQSPPAADRAAAAPSASRKRSHHDVGLAPEPLEAVDLDLQQPEARVRQLGDAPAIPGLNAASRSGAPLHDRRISGRVRIEERQPPATVDVPRQAASRAGCPIRTPAGLMSSTVVVDPRLPAEDDGPVRERPVGQDQAPGRSGVGELPAQAGQPEGKELRARPEEVEQSHS